MVQLMTVRFNGLLQHTANKMEKGGERDHQKWDKTKNVAVVSGCGAAVRWERVELKFWSVLLVPHC